MSCGGMCTHMFSTCTCQHATYDCTRDGPWYVLWGHVYTHVQHLHMSTRYIWLHTRWTTSHSCDNWSTDAGGIVTVPHYCKEFMQPTKEPNSFFGTFAKLRKKTTNSFMSVRPSVCMEQLNSNQMDFHELLYLSTFRKTVGKIQVSLKSDKNNGYFT
jgi:hypothetical protein